MGKQLGKKFPDCKIFADEVPQGFKEPCFQLECTEIKNSLYLTEKSIANHLCCYAIKLRTMVFCAVYRIIFLNDRVTFFERIHHMLSAEIFCKTSAPILLWNRSADPVYILIKCTILFLKLQIFQRTASGFAGSVCYIDIHHTDKTFAPAQNHIQLFQIVCIDIPKIENHDFVIFCVLCTLDDLHGNPAKFLSIPTAIRSVSSSEKFLRRFSESQNSKKAS